MANMEDSECLFDAPTPSILLWVIAATVRGSSAKLSDLATYCFSRGMNFTNRKF